MFKSNRKLKVKTGNLARRDITVKALTLIKNDRSNVMYSAINYNCCVVNRDSNIIPLAGYLNRSATIANPCTGGAI